MGGSGSGRWGSYTKKRTVEECSSLSINVLLPAIRKGIGKGVVAMPGGRGEWWIRQNGRAVLILHNRCYWLPLVARILSTGVTRWFFACPGCSTQVQKLYLMWYAPTRGWGCRGCHNLRYTSSQQQRKDSVFIQRLMAEIEVKVARDCIMHKRMVRGDSEEHM
jgi:hypothetical protein